MSEKLKAEIIILEIGPDGQIFEDKVIPLDLARGILRETHIIVPKADLLTAAEALIDEYPDDFDEAILGQKLKAMIKE